MRVQQIRNIGVIEGDEPVSPNEWEKLELTGKIVIKNGIDKNMSGKECVVVLVGEKTAQRKYVKYEIQQAWNTGKGIIGIYIHNINCARNGKCHKGINPFEQFAVGSLKLSDIVQCYNPRVDAYKNISDNIEITSRQQLKIRNSN